MQVIAQNGVWSLASDFGLVLREGSIPFQSDAEGVTHGLQVLKNGQLANNAEIYIVPMPVENTVSLPDFWGHWIGEGRDRGADWSLRSFGSEVGFTLNNDDIAEGDEVFEVLVYKDNDNPLFGDMPFMRVTITLQDDDINGTTGHDLLQGSALADFLRGYVGNDTLNGDGGNDALYGQGGNDILIGGAGDDTLDGGDGYDTVEYRAASSGIRVDLAKTVAQDVGGGQGRDILRNFESVVGSLYNDMIVGDVRANNLRGNNGNDTLRGAGGNDILDGGSGFDYASFADATNSVNVSLAVSAAQFISSNLGSDKLISIEGLFGSRYADKLVGNNGNNHLLGGSGNDTLRGVCGNDKLDGGAGVDTADYTGVSAIRVNLGTTAAQNTGHGIDRLISIESVVSGNGNDHLTGSSGANRLVGNAGNDTLLGGGGNDSLEGGSGNDYLDGGSGIDTIYFNGSTAAVVSLASTAAQATGHGTDRILNVENVSGGSGSDRLTGNSSANQLFGNEGHDRLSGGAGNDTLAGGSGNDIIDGGTGTDRVVFETSASIRVNLTSGIAVGEGTDRLISIEQVFTGAGRDTHTGDLANNYLSSGEGNDTLSGGAGNDWLLGGSGNDRLRGGTGNDVLYGGAGNDVFVFAKSEGRDRIMDFQDNADRIEITGNYDYDDLTIVRSSTDTVVKFGGTTIVIEDVSSFYVNEADFIFS